MADSGMIGIRISSISGLPLKYVAFASKRYDWFGTRSTSL